MRKNYLYQILITLFLFQIGFSQEKEDQILKDSLYHSFKNKVVNYSFKDFDQLFFEYHKMVNDDTIKILTKIEYYSYTIKIATFNDRYAALYPKEKEIALKNKQEWYDKNYSNYLLVRQKKCY